MKIILILNALNLPDYASWPELVFAVEETVADVEEFVTVISWDALFEEEAGERGNENDNNAVNKLKITRLERNGSRS